MAQQIYLNYRNTSNIFSRCVAADQNHHNDYDLPDCAYLLTQSLYTFGFIAKLLSKTDNSGVSIEPMSGSHVLELMGTMKLSNRRPIFLIDECILPHDNMLGKLKFVRNCFRSLRLGLVMLGTDSRAAKLPSSINASSRSDVARPWCYIFSSYPASNLNLLTLPKNCPEWYQNTLVHSRPLFSHFLSIEAANSRQTFDSLLERVFNLVVEVKKIFQDYYGQLGQIRLFQNAHSKLADLGEKRTALIQSHFAQLSGGKQLVLKNNGCLSGQHEIWNPCSVFPSVENDVLLYLILMGGKNYPAFKLENTLVPYAYFLLKVTSNTDHRSHILDLSNAVQEGNDGNFLESWYALRCVCPLIVMESQE